MTRQPSRHHGDRLRPCRAWGLAPPKKAAEVCSSVLLFFCSQCQPPSTANPGAVVYLSDARAGKNTCSSSPSDPVREGECMLPGSLFHAHVMGPRAEQHLPGGKGAVAGRIHAPRSTTQHTHTLGQRDIQTARTVPLSWPAVLSAPLSRPGKNAPAEIPRPRRLRHDS